MSIPNTDDTTPEPTPLLTESEQQHVLDLLHEWWKSSVDGRRGPIQQTESLLGLFVTPRTWKRRK